MAEDNRSPERLRHHYEVERELAQRLRNSTREERTKLFCTLYGELFTRVPDHPRAVRRETPESIRRAVASRMALLRGHLNGVKTFLEFAPGDCTLAFEMCQHAKEVIGVDISDQTGSLANPPKNFNLLVYDGYKLDLPSDSVDLAFSYQFLEHLHPDDVEPHFQLIHRILRPGGAYIFSTPHRYSGPHDVSRGFTEEPTAFHFKEWTYRELHDLAKNLGFSAAHTYRFGKSRESSLWNAATFTLEALFGLLPRQLQRSASARLFQGVTMIVRK